jgi:Protein of unknown function (DUF3106)
VSLSAMYSNNFFSFIKTIEGSSLALGIVASALICNVATATAQPSANEPAALSTAVSTFRKSLIPVAQPLWVDLSAEQKSFLKPFESQWYTLSAAERKSWATLATKVPRMSSAEQKKATARANEWAALSPDQRKLARSNYRLAQSLPQDERTAQWEQYQSMTPAQRAVLRSAGWTSNTAAKHAGAATGLAKEASQPIKEIKAKTTKPIGPRLADAQKN